MARIRFPPVLYHGTQAENLSSICKRGLLRGTVERCGQVSRDANFVADCVGNVSLATKEKDAIFFAVASSTNPYGEQAIIHVDTRKIRRSACVKRVLFDRGAEFKCFTDIPPSAITGIHIRKPVWRDGKLHIVDMWERCRDRR